MKQRKKSFGMRISAFVLSFAMVCTLLAGVNVVAFAADDDLSDTVSVQKFYYDVDKGGNGEHIYTIDEDEISWYKSLPSWNDEGEAWKAPLFSEVPVYRVANYNTGEHLWITDKGYVDYLVGIGWTQEQGVAFYSDENEGVPVYRLWDGTGRVGSHHYSTDAGEIAWLVSIGWQNEGPQFYGVKGEPAAYSLEATQTDADEITVTSPDGEFTGLETFTVSHNGLADEFADFDYVEELDAFVITLANPIEDAFYTVTCSDSDFSPVTFQGKEYGEKEMTAEQISANEAVVTLTGEPTGEEEFEVYDGESEVSVEFEFVTDNEVKITFDEDLDDASYTIVCSDEGYAPTTLVAQSAKPVALVFEDDLFVLQADGSAVAKFSVLDQFEHPFDDQSLTDFTTPGYTSQKNYNDGQGTLTITANTGSSMAVGTKVPVSAFYANGSMSVLTSLTISGASTIESVVALPVMVNPAITLAAETDPDAQAALVLLNSLPKTAEFFKNPLYNGLQSYVLPVVVYDQYGDAMTATQVNAALSTTLSVSPLFPDKATAEANVFGAAPYGTFLQGPEGVIYLELTGNGVKSGSQTVSFLEANGDREIATIDVADNIVIDEVAFEVETLYMGSQSEMLIEATDNYGNDVDLSAYTITPNGSSLTITRNGAAFDTTTFTASNATFTTVGNAVKVTPTSAQFPVQITYSTATGEQGSQSFSVKAAKTATSIKGILEPSLVLGGTQDQLELNLYPLLSDEDTYTPVFYDQYNEAIDVDPYDGTQQANEAYFKVEAVGTHTYSSVDSDYNINMDAQPQTATKETYKITLHRADGTEVTKNFDVTIAGDAVSFTAGLAKDNKLFVGETSLTTGQMNAILIYAKDAAGNVYPVSSGQQTINVQFRGTTGSTINVGGTAVIENTDGVITVSAAQAYNPADEETLVDGTVLIDVYANGVLIDTEELSYSNYTRIASGIVCKDVLGNEYDLDDGIICTADGEYSYWQDGDYDCDITIIPTGNMTDGFYTINAVDQYGLETPMTVTVGGQPATPSMIPVEFNNSTTMIISANAGLMTQVVQVTV